MNVLSGAVEVSPASSSEVTVELGEEEYISNLVAGTQSEDLITSILRSCNPVTHSLVVHTQITLK